MGASITNDLLSFKPTNIKGIWQKALKINFDPSSIGYMESAPLH